LLDSGVTRRLFYCSCEGGHLAVYDGTSHPGNHRYPPHTFCGQIDRLAAVVYTSGHVAEAELRGGGLVMTSSGRDVTMAFKYVNTGG